MVSALRCSSTVTPHFRSPGRTGSIDRTALTSLQKHAGLQQSGGFSGSRALGRSSVWSVGISAQCLLVSGSRSLERVECRGMAELSRHPFRAQATLRGFVATASVRKPCERASWRWRRRGASEVSNCYEGPCAASDEQAVLSAFAGGSVALSRRRCWQIDLVEDGSGDERVEELFEPRP